MRPSEWGRRKDILRTGWPFKREDEEIRHTISVANSKRPNKK
jgi:hypothetical protein